MQEKDASEAKRAYQAASLAVEAALVQVQRSRSPANLAELARCLRALQVTNAHLVAALEAELKGQ